MNSAEMGRVPMEILEIPINKTPPAPDDKCFNAIPGKVKKENK